MVQAALSESWLWDGARDHSEFLQDLAVELEDSQAQPKSKSILSLQARFSERLLETTQVAWRSKAAESSGQSSLLKASSRGKLATDGQTKGRTQAYG